MAERMCMECRESGFDTPAARTYSGKLVVPFSGKSMAVASAITGALALLYTHDLYLAAFLGTGIGFCLLVYSRLSPGAPRPLDRCSYHDWRVNRAYYSRTFEEYLGTRGGNSWHYLPSVPSDAAMKILTLVDG